MSESELITVATFTNTAEAELSRERLRLEGVVSFVTGMVTSHVLPYAAAADGAGISLCVSAADADQAREILGTA